jgi:hypothetical protein
MTLLRFGHIHTQKKKVDFVKKIQTLQREYKQKRNSDREEKLETNLREKDERVKEREVRIFLDSRKNCDNNVATFFSQIHGKNYRLHQVVLLGSSILRY